MWDKDQASIGQDGCLEKVEISLNIANFFFKLDVDEFPILSSLSFDDYDMFSGSNIDSLVGELLAAVSTNPLISESVQSIFEFVLKTKSLRKEVLFDPFRMG